MNQLLLSKAATYCAKAEHCSGEIRAKLRQWGATPSEVTEVLNYLHREHFYDDARYSRYFVRDKFRFNRWGRMKMRFMLAAKEIGEDMVTEALAEIDEMQYVQALAELIAAKVDNVQTLSDYVVAGKIYRFAVGRGFEPDTIKKAVKLLQQKKQEL